MLRKVPDYIQLSKFLHSEMNLFLSFFNSLESHLQNRHNKIFPGMLLNIPRLLMFQLSSPFLAFGKTKSSLDMNPFKTFLINNKFICTQASTHLSGMKEGVLQSVCSITSILGHRIESFPLPGPHLWLISNCSTATTNSVLFPHIFWCVCFFFFF